MKALKCAVVWIVKAFLFNYLRSLKLHGYFILLLKKLFWLITKERYDTMFKLTICASFYVCYFYYSFLHDTKKRNFLSVTHLLQYVFLLSLYVLFAYVVCDWNFFLKKKHSFHWNWLSKVTINPKAAGHIRKPESVLQAVFSNRKLKCDSLC